MKHLVIALFCVMTMAGTAFGKSYQSGTSASTSEMDYTWAKDYGPWDFSGLVGWYNPGLGIQALAAYRILDTVIPNADDSLSAESGLGFLSVNESIGGVSTSYTAFEIPIMARWDFRLPDTAFMMGPRAGFSYLSASSTVNVGGVSYTGRGGGLFFQVGGFAMYRLQEQLWLRADLGFGGYTNIRFGITYAL